MRTARCLVLHGYSARNRGDGLLVEHAIEIARATFGDDVEITLVANHPKTFEHLGVRVIDSGLRRHGFSRQYLAELLRLGAYDLVLGVGGAYLRFGRAVESLKAGVVHGPQLLAAALTTAPTVYLPQSVGPLRGGSRAVLRPLLRRLDVVWSRDDRTTEELALPNVRRTVDLALHDVAGSGRRAGSTAPEPVPVLSVRSVDGRVPTGVMELADLLRPFDGYVQSTAGSNDDRPATAAIRPDRVLARSDLLSTQGRRVVVAVRMHAALMALAAGHYVIHLAYERKGFSAFADLGLAEYVHNVRRFSPRVVEGQVDRLRDEPGIREAYDVAVRTATRDLPRQYEELLADTRARARRRTEVAS